MPDPKALASELLTRFTYADGYRRQYDERAIRNYKLFTGHRDPLPANLRGRSNLHIPRTYELVDALRARFMRALFGQSPVVEFIPDPLLYFQEGADPVEYLDMLARAEDSAKYSTYLVDQQLRLSGVYKQCYDFMTSFLVFPAGILSVGWKYQEKLIKKRGQVFDPELGIYTEAVLEEQAVTYDDNELAYVDYFDFWPDPRGTDLDSCRFVFHREWCTEAELKEKLAVLERAGSGKVYEPEDWQALVAAGSSLTGGASERMAEVGISAETGQGHWEDIRRGYLIELLHYWEDGRHAIIANRIQTVFDGGNPYWHGKKPFLCASFDPKPGEFYGFSAVEIIEHLQHELNTLRNQRIDNVSFVLNRMWWVRRGADIDENDLVSRPAGIIYSELRDDIETLTTPDVTSSAYSEENIIKEDMDNALGAPAVVRGTEPGRRQTASEVVIKSGSADIKFQSRIMLYETVMERLAVLMDMNNQQFVDRPRVFRVEDTWKLVTPEEIRGHHMYRPASQNLDMTANREVRRQQVLELMKVIQGNPHIDQWELVKLVLDAYGIRGTERVLLPRPPAQPAPVMSALPGASPLPASQVPPVQQPAPPAPASVDQVMSAVLGQAMEAGGGV